MSGMSVASQVLLGDDVDAKFAEKHRNLCNTKTKRVLTNYPEAGLYATVQTSPILGELLLTANTCFFDDPDAGKLIALKTTDIAVKPDELNNNAVFDGIDKIFEENDKITWFFSVGVPGQPTAQLHDLTLQIALEPRVYPANPGPKLTNSTGSWDAELVVDLDNVQTTYEPNLTAAVTTATIRMQQVPEGIKTLKVFLKNNFKGKLGIGVLRYVKVWSSNASTSFSVLRARWRPAAVHTTFRCSNTSNVSAWVCKQRKVDDALLGAFSPMSSGTGYVGIGMDRDGQAGNSGMPFSAWVHGDDEPIPPTNEWSFFTAIGNPDAYIRVFHHEGNGVKIEKYDTLWVGNTSKDYVTCLKVNPQPFAKFSNGVLLTYTAFWFDEDAVRPGTQEKGVWRLYAELQAFKPRYAGLKLGGFVEVTGGSEEQRTGHVVRGVKYQMYAKDKNTNSWHLVDRMAVGEAGQITEKNWTVAHDHFEARNGGVPQRLLPSTKEVGLAAVPSQLPVYMKYISDVDNFVMPYPVLESFEGDHASNAEVIVNVQVPGFVDGEPSSIEVFYGPQDQLTLTTEWPLSVTAAVTSSRMQVRLPTSKFVISELEAGTSMPQTGYGSKNNVLGFTGTLYARVKFSNKNLQTYSVQTAKTILQPDALSTTTSTTTSTTSSATTTTGPQRLRRACAVYCSKPKHSKKNKSQKGTQTVTPDLASTDSEQAE